MPARRNRPRTSQAATPPRRWKHRMEALRLRRPTFELLENRRVLATLTSADSILTITLDGNNEALGISSTASGYALTSNRPFTDGGIDASYATGFGTSSVAITSLGSFYHNTIRIVDGAGVQNTGVTFNHGFGNAFLDNFEIVLDDDTDVVEGEYSVNFNGVNDFGTSSLSVTTTRNISLFGSEVSARGVSFKANVAGTSTGSFVGIVASSGATIRSTGTGALHLEGRGGVGNTFRTTYGVLAEFSSQIIGGGEGSAATIVGTGGSGTQGNSGVRITSSSLISSSGASVSVTGIGGVGTPGGNIGVDVFNGGQISAGGGGSVTVHGTGGTVGHSNSGVRVQGYSNQTMVSSIGSNYAPVQVIGIGGSSPNTSNTFGVQVFSGYNEASPARIFAGGDASVNVQGSAGNAPGSFNHGVWLSEFATITSTRGNVQVVGFGSTNTSSPQQSIGVNLGASAVITAGGTGTVRVEGTGGNGTSNFNHGVLLTRASSLITSESRSVHVIGRGGASNEFNNCGVVVEEGRITAGATALATVTVEGTGGNGFNSYGVQVGGGIDAASSAMITSSGGNVHINGEGKLGSTGNGNAGVTIYEGDVISAGGMGTLTIEGTGGSYSSGSAGAGVYLSGGTITSSGGAVSVSGRSGDGAYSTHGVFVNGTITAGANGTVSVQGTGGTGRGGNGVYIYEYGHVTSGGGAIEVVGQGGDTIGFQYATGVVLRQGGRITNVGYEPLTVVGTSGLGTSDSQGVGVIGRRSDGTTSAITSNGAIRVTGKSVNDIGIHLDTYGTLSSLIGIELISDRIEFDGSATANAGGGYLMIRQQTNGTSVQLRSGGAYVPGTLQISNTELSCVTAGDIYIGDVNSGDMLISNMWTTLAARIHLASGGNINLDGFGTSFDWQGGTLWVSPGPNGAVRPLNTGTDVSVGSGTFRFVDGSDLEIAINGTVPNTGYQQLKVDGGIVLAGVDLVLSGSHVPTEGESFVIVAKDSSGSIAGQFNGLPEGAILSNLLGSGRSARITYVGGNGNDVVLTVFDAPPMITSNGGGSTASVSVPENTTAVTTVAATDDGPNHTLAFSIISGGDSSRFTINSATGMLAFIDAPNFEMPSDQGQDNVYNVTVQVSDGHGGVDTQAIAVTVTDVNEAPATLELSNSIFYNTDPVGTTVGTLSVFDPDVGDHVTYTFVPRAGQDDSAGFTIEGNELKTATTFSFLPVRNLHLRVRATDAGGLFVERDLFFLVTRVNTPPFDLHLTHPAVEERQNYSGFVQAQDVDSEEQLNYFLAFSPLPNDNGFFTLDSNTGELQLRNTIDYEQKSSYSIFVGVRDLFGVVTTDTLTISVIDINEAPITIELSNSTVFERVPIGTVVGTLSATDPDAGDSVVGYEFHPWNGTDNSSFTIDGNLIRTAVELDYQIKPSHQIVVQAIDSYGAAGSQQFTISVLDVSEPPSDVALSHAAVAENQVSGTTVGTFSATDPDGDMAFTYSLVPGEGSQDNASFVLEGSTLKTAQTFNFEQRAAFSIRVRVMDPAGNFVEKIFLISIVDANDYPNSGTLTNQTVLDGSPAGSTVGEVQAYDVDAGDSVTVSLPAGIADNSAFILSGTTLKIAIGFNYEIKSSYLVTLRVTDSAGLFRDSQFVIRVVNFISNTSFLETAAIGSIAAVFAAQDPDVQDLRTYQLVSGPGSEDNAAFTTGGNSLYVATPINYETKSSYRIRVRATDANGLFVEKAFVLTVIDFNEPPTNLALSNTRVDENVLSGTLIGLLSASDPEGNPNITYSLPTVFLDNAKFAISGNTLRTLAPIDYEAQSSFRILVRATDADFHSADKTYTIQVTNSPIEQFLPGDFGWGIGIGNSLQDVQDLATAITTDLAGNVYVAGTFNGTVDFDPSVSEAKLTGNGGGFIAKYSPDGALVWAKALTTTYYAGPTGIAVDPAGNVYATGNFGADVSFGPGITKLTAQGWRGSFVCKLDASGNYLWAKAFSGSIVLAAGIAVDGTGNVYTTGWFDYTADFNPGNGVYNLLWNKGAAFISKLDTNGAFVWAKNFGGTGAKASALSLDAAGNVYTTGSFSGTADFDPSETVVANLTTPTNSHDVFVSKLSAAGTYIWARAFGGTGTDEGRGIAVDNSGNVFTTGTFTATADFDPSPGTSNLISAGSSDVFVSKLTSTGAFAWARSLGGVAADVANGIAVDAAGSAYVTGRRDGAYANPDPYAPLSSSQAFVQKFTATGQEAWSKALRATSLAEGTGITVDTTGNVYVAGTFTGVMDFDPGLGVVNMTSRNKDAFIAKLSQAYLSAGGTASNGYLVGATAYFDANFNGVLDGSEASAITDALGAFTLDVPLSVDLNQNGLLDDEEGQWVVVGGTDSSTGLPAVDKLVAPGSWSVVTPLTTLVSTLATSGGMSVADATERVIEVFGLPAVDLSELEPIADAIAGDAGAAAVFAAHAKLQDMVSQSIAVLVGADLALDAAAAAEHLMTAIGDLLVNPELSFDLSDELVARAILYQAASSSGVALSDELVAGAASVIAAANQAIDAIPVSADAAYLAQVAQVKIVSQGAIAPLLQAAAAGAGDIEEVVTNNTGAALDAQIGAAETPPTLIVPNAIVAEATSAAGAIVTFEASATNLAGESIPVALSLPSGHEFPLGTTTVTATATIGGQTVIASFTITVLDTVGPELTVPQDIFIVSNAAGGANVVFDPPTAVDLVDPQPTVTFDAESGFFPLGETTVTYTASDAAGNETIATFVIVVLAAESEVVGRHIFYNQSAWDGNSAAIDPASDEAAIATDKQPYFAGAGVAVYNNITSFSRGINGLMIDLSAGVDHSGISAGDFVFKVGNNNAPNTWAAAPAPAAISVIPGGGVDGSDRVIITWTSGSIANKWLEVQVLPTATTGLATTDVFFWGNKIGDSGTNPGVGTFDTTTVDAAQAFSSLGGNKPISDLRDYNRSKDVTTSDAALVFANLGSIVRLNIGVDGPFAPEAEPAVAGRDDSGSAIAVVLASGTYVPSEVISDPHAECLPRNPGGISSRTNGMDSYRTPHYKVDELIAAKKDLNLAKLHEITDAVVLDDVLLEDLFTDRILQDLIPSAYR